MDNQPYIVNCGACGTLLQFDLALDQELDMTLDVYPCKQCLEDAKNV